MSNPEFAAAVEQAVQNRKSMVTEAESGLAAAQKARQLAVTPEEVAYVETMEQFWSDQLRALLKDGL